MQYHPVLRKLTKFLKRILPFDLGQYELRYVTKGKLIAYQLVSPLSGGKALDLGCRDGYWAEQLKKKGYDVTAVDIEPHYSGAIRVDANERLPFRDNEFDLVWCAEVIEHLADPGFTINECRRVLRPGGTLMMTTPNRGFWLFRFLGWMGILPRIVNEDHHHFLSFSDLDALAPGGAFYGFFPYWLVKWRVRRGACWLSPTIVWRSCAEERASYAQSGASRDALPGRLYHGYGSAAATTPLELTPSSSRPALSAARTWVCVIVVLLLSSAIYFGNASWPALLDDADASHALVAREMLQRGDWTVLYLNGIRYLMKAPLHYWTVAAAYALFGQNEFTTRLPVAIAMVLLALMNFEFGRRFFGARTGFYAGIVISTSVGSFIFTRIMIPEALYALQFAAMFYLFLRAWTGSLSPRIGYWSVAALSALAVLTRGLVGVVFPLAALAGFITLTRGWSRWRELHLASCTAVFLVIAAPWHVLAELRAPGFLWSYFINEHVNRALGTRYPPDYDAVPLLLWWVAHLAWLFPWSIFLPLLWREWPRLGPARAPLTHQDQARLLVWLWGGTILAFFSVIPGSRMEYYSFAAWPAIAILLGVALERAENSAGARRLQAALAGVGLAIAAALLFMVWNAAPQVSGDISQRLQVRNNDSYRLSMSHLLDLTPAAFADLRAPALAAAFVFAVALPAAWWFRRRSKNLTATAAMGLGMVGFAFAANTALAVFEPHMSSRPLAREVQKYLRPEDQVVIYGEFSPGSSLAYYTARRVFLYNGRYSNLEFGSYYRDAPPIFLSDQDFPAFWQGSRRVFLFVQPQVRGQALARLATLPENSVYLVADIGGKQIFTNQPLAPNPMTLAEFLAGTRARR